MASISLSGTLCVRVREAGYRLLIALDVYVHHFGSRTFHGLGFDVRRQLQENFARFGDKWGLSYTVGYHLPPPTPEANTRSAAAEMGTVTSEGQTEDVPDAEGILPPDEGPESARENESPQVVSSEDSLGQPTESDGDEFKSWISDKARISLCMIVRNEEHHLPDCLRSIEGVFDEVIVVDTGSSDRTREVARAFGAQVFDFPWPDSFAVARNKGLEHATGQWVMWLDADDRLDEENRGRLRELLAGLGEELDAYAMKVRSVLDAGRTAFRLLDQVRLFRNLPEVRWDYRVHEQILGAVNRAGGGVRWADVTIDHVGYQDPSFRRRKLERNLRLLELDHGERPDDAFTLFNLGWTLLDLGRTEEALEQLQHSLKETRPTSSTLRKLYHLLALAHRSLGQPDAALQVCRDGLERFPDDAELLCEQGLFLRDQGDLAGAAKSWERLLDARRGQYFASEEVGLRGYKTRHLLAEIYRAQERWTEAEVQWRAALAEQPRFEPAWHDLAELYLRRERWTDLEYFLEELEAQGAPAPRIGWLRARAQFHRGEYLASRRTLHEVIAQDPRAIGPRVLLSHVLIQEGRDWRAAERAEV